ncbi:PTS N-acetylglucosamine transporter subunit IIBC [Sporolactobacillus shoreicorticis]|uniref:PTS sugar transporter subunit IIA n=1 Tax=Sporolactobacillus shoreicorticis TaxID=1923877 RepID=A0ABW5S116_9BACL|nr:PTS N-acetylglucosamine transporter subunit IIBC [Sporolactobacillus shoreicorticis]MCO7124695.1 PTS N-acetylglucosamine transporter subunit IIBC [Sporolactobacillus shoreicorticis]
MKRKIIVASHHRLAGGLRDTLRFIGGEAAKTIEVLTAYINSRPIDEEVARLMEADSDTEIIILTDMMAGSVNQQFMRYVSRAHTHLITGVNLPLALAFMMETSNSYLTNTRVRAIVADAQHSIIYMNEKSVEVDADDE